MKYILVKNKYGDVVINLTEAIENKRVPITEGMDNTSISDIQKIIDKELPKKIEALVKKQLDSNTTEEKIVEIVKNCMTQLFKALWTKRGSWKGSIKNDSN